MTQEESNTGKTPIEQLAVLMHGSLCHQNHTDQCGWFYEKDFTGWTHQTYLLRAEHLEKNTTSTLPELLQAITVLRELRTIWAPTRNVS